MRRIATFLALFLVASTGAPAQSRHTVSLSWIASTDAADNPSLTYNVYRSAACSGTFVKLNASPDAATTYLDSAVFPGTYCYQVTAVLTGAESVPSNVVAAVIPAEILAQPVQAPCAHRGAIIGWLRCVAAMQRAQSKKTAP